jgi:MFS family permease
VAVRILLGVGTSGAYPAAMRILRERGEATGSKPPRFVFGVMTLSAFSTTAVGPVIGGLLVSAFGWQSIFTINVPLALIAALSILIWTPHDRAPAHTFARLMKDIDLVGIALFAAFLLSLMAFLMNLKGGPPGLRSRVRSSSAPPWLRTRCGDGSRSSMCACWRTTGRSP